MLFFSEIFSLTQRTEETSYNTEYQVSWEVKFVTLLKEVEMEFNGKENETELSKYLIKIAEALQKMTTVYSSRLSARQFVKYL